MLQADQCIAPLLLYLHSLLAAVQLCPVLTKDRSVIVTIF